MRNGDDRCLSFLRDETAGNLPDYLRVSERGIYPPLLKEKKTADISKIKEEIQIENILDPTISRGNILFPIGKWKTKKTFWRELDERRRKVDYFVKDKSDT